MQVKSKMIKSLTCHLDTGKQNYKEEYNKCSMKKKNKKQFSVICKPKQLHGWVLQYSIIIIIILSLYLRKKIILHLLVGVVISRF